MAGIAVCVHVSAKVGSGPTSRRQKCSSSSQSSANLRSLLKFGKLDEAVRMMELPDSGYGSIEADLERYSLVLHACICQRSLEHGRRVHMGLLECRSHGSKLLDDPNLKTKLITLYSVCGQLDEARRVFEEGIEVGLASKSMWLAMLIACSRNDCSKEALLMYAKMQHQFIRPCNFAFSSALKACSNMLELQFGRAVHAQIAKFEEPPDQIVNNALMKFYSDCGSLEDVLGLFERMPQKDVVSWNCLIGGFIRSNYLLKALDTFRRMQVEEVSFTLVTLTMILPVCARLTALSSGKEIHSQLLKSKRRPDIFVLNSLMDMYAKCGAVTHCREVFNGMPNKDLTSWNTMIMGYAVNGFADEALNLFDEMIKVGLKPNDVTFISLLSGCSHTGFTSEGQILFERMEKEFGLSPSLEHYACLVDLLGRAGRINEAFDVINNMPMSPGGSILGSLLNSCRLHGNITIGELVAKELFKIEPQNPGNYVILSNMYATAGRWDAVKELREMMENKGIKKEAGCSWLQIKSKLYTFVAGGCTKFRSSVEFEMYWDKLEKSMKELGYIPDTSVVLHNVDEELKASWVCGHSERLAAVYSLIHTGSSTTIRITKNLRVCVDCHTWMKFVSKVTRREIVLRDTNRFHHFEDGACSCKDYW